MTPRTTASGTSGNGGFAPSGAAMDAERLVAVLLVASLWLVTRPYAGIVHDAQLYLAQAMHRIDPETFGSDIFFRYGSQDRYSIISLIYAPAIRALGPAQAHLAFFAMASGLWLASLYALARSLFGKGCIAMAACITPCVMIPTYTFGALQFGEPFATPRLLVEALTMAAIACLCSGRRVGAFALCLLALALHPVMALGALVLLLAMSGPVTRVLLPALATAGLAAIGFGLSGIDPFARLFIRMDDDWRTLVTDWSKHAFVAHWAWPTLVQSVLPLVCLGLAARRGTAVQARLATAAIAIGAGCVLVSWIGGDRLANLLILNLQLWRATWLAVLLSACFAPAVFARLPADGRSRPLFLCAIAANVIEARLGGTTIPFASATLALATLLACAAHRLGTAQRALQLGASFLAAIATLLLAAEIAGFATRYDHALIVDAAQRGAIIASLVALACATLLRKNRLSLHIALPLVLVLSLCSALIADRRDARMRLITSDSPIDPAFVTALSGRTVYWEKGLELLWFRLRQPSYYSCFQSAGIMFFRGTALEIARRASVLSKLDTADFPTAPDVNCPKRANPDANGPTSRAQLEQACRALPDLDALVLLAKVPDAPHLSWQPGFPLPASTTSPIGAQTSYNLYSCPDFREPHHGRRDTE